MSRGARTSVVAAGGAVVLFAALAGGTVRAQTETAGPEVTLEASQLAPGDFAVYTLAGFEARGVIVTFCGNEGLRGATDCNMTESDGLPLRGPETRITSRTPVAVPPVPCPCIVRVSSTDNDEIAVAPINIIGHPTGELVAPAGFVQPLTINVEVDKAPSGVMDRLRASAGGPGMYDVTISVQNRSTTAVRNINLSGSAGREPTEDVATIAADDLDVLESGQTATQTVQVELPSLTLGDAEWRVTASGVGPSITATDTTSQSAWLLWALGIVFVIDLTILAARLIFRMRSRPSRRDPDDSPFIDPPDGSIGPGGHSELDGQTDAQWRKPQLVA